MSVDLPNRKDEHGHDLMLIDIEGNALSTSLPLKDLRMPSDAAPGWALLILCLRSFALARTCRIPVVHGMNGTLIRMNSRLATTYGVKL